MSPVEQIATSLEPHSPYSNKKQTVNIKKSQVILGGKYGKHCRKKRHLVSISNFSISHNVFLNCQHSDDSKSVPIRRMFKSLKSNTSLERLYIFNPFPHKNAFWRLCSKWSLKTLWQKEKMLKTSNFPFCDSVFNSFQ